MNTYVTGTTIKQLREAKRLTQAELGEKIGVSSKTVSKWEMGTASPSLENLQILSTVLAVDLATETETEISKGEQKWKVLSLVLGCLLLVSLLALGAALFHKPAVDKSDRPAASVLNR